ncbi:uncharacterized protein LOC110029243 [Phalaenopsis equestris]|uniref:uncharacterized protein LOC110029243 n=1 Tax=Phalaenopsis equestris TaxID=78828 RepID=UPI0009E583CD|nr:uncharacterized protein LOC110029243 [Phalaenopsis equestris]
MGLKFSFVSIADALNRLSFTAAGLRRDTIAVDSSTTIRCWFPPSFSKPPLLLLHGFGTSATWQWRPQIAALATHFDLIVPDLIFFGGSTTLSPERSEKFQAEAMVALLGKLGISGEVVGVVGTSYGGFVAYHVAKMLGEAWVGKVVIASSDLGKTEEDDLAMTQRAGGVHTVEDILLPSSAAGLRLVLRLAFHRPPSFLPNFVLRDALRKLFNDNLAEKKELLRGITLGNKDLFQLTPLPQDILIIWGEHDRFFPLNKAYEVKKKLGENAKLEVMKNTGHVPQLEDPNQFNKLLLSFLLAEDEK